jgi:hypothetical protein
MIKVNTLAINETANALEASNNKMRDDLDSPSAAIKRLESGWRGDAAYEGIGKFNHIKSTYCEQRYMVMRDLVFLMRRYIDATYEEVERQILKSAALFR